MWEGQRTGKDILLAQPIGGLVTLETITNGHPSEHLDDLL